MKKSILFLCTGNSCRSQMAEGLANRLFSDKISACSAGTRSQGINPRAIAVMRELGIDITGQESQDVREFLDREFDYYITLCGNARESCPALPGPGQRLHWGLPDPAAATGSEDDILDAFRRVRDDSKIKIQELVNTL